MPPQQRPAWQRAIITLSAAVTAAILIVFLYVGRVVLIPIAMAIFFTYVLSPVVSYLQRRGLPRPAAVIATVIVTVGLFLLSSFIVTRELSSLSQTIAEHSESIKAKVAAARDTILGTTDSPLSALLDDIDKTVSPQKPAAETVVLEPRRSAWTPSLDTIVGPATEAFGQAAFSFILVVFMLLSKTDLADRVLRLLGDAQVSVATRAMSDASNRISRYLFRQLVVNVAFGLMIAIGLWAMGISYALLWGALISVMRYVPFIGTWIGVIPPTLYAVAVGSGWSEPAIVFGFIIGSELLVNNFVEPRLYGQSLGVSEVAQLIAAAFWSFLWGPVGLILSGPITTCLLVIGRHAPAFRFFEILLGTEPALTPSLALFQRLIGNDHDEALRVVRQATPQAEPQRVFDETIIPALAQVKKARLDGQVDADEEKTIFSMAKEIIADTLEEPKPTTTDAPRVRIMACPAQDEYDRLTLDMLLAQLPPSHWDSRTTSVSTLTAELLADAAGFRPQVIVIGSMPPGGNAHARYLIKKLRTRFPEAHIVAGRWTEAKPDTAAWKEAGADAVSESLTATVKHLQAWKPVLVNPDKPLKISVPA